MKEARIVLTRLDIVSISFSITEEAQVDKNQFLIVSQSVFFEIFKMTKIHIGTNQMPFLKGSCYE